MQTSLQIDLPSTSPKYQHLAAFWKDEDSKDGLPRRKIQKSQSDKMSGPGQLAEKNQLLAIWDMIDRQAVVCWIVCLL